jgi:hypothetical protein
VEEGGRLKSEEQKERYRGVFSRIKRISMRFERLVKRHHIAKENRDNSFMKKS